MKMAFRGFSKVCRWRRLLSVVSLIGLFAGFYCYVLLRIRPELFYQQKPHIFLFDYGFFSSFVDRPGGLVEYVSAFLSPLFVCDWAGALVVTVLTTIICLATHQFTTAVTGTGSRILSLVPAVLILMLLGQYIHPVRVCVGLAFVLILANAYVWLGARSCLGVRLTTLVAASALVYYLAAGLYVVFACMCGAFELGVKRHSRLATLWVLCAAAVPIIVGMRLLDLSLTEACRGLMLAKARHWLEAPSPLAMAIQTGLLLFFPAAAIGLASRRHATGLPATKSKAQIGRNRRAAGGRLPDRPVSRVCSAARLGTLAILAVGAVAVSFDHPKRCLLEIACRGEQRRWDDVLAQSRRLPPSERRVWDARTVSDVNRALYFRGELLDRMFAYPQVLDTPSLTLSFESPTAMAQATPRQCSQILFDLGRVNESEHMGYEAMEVHGDQPQILKRLALIAVIKGQPEAARRFLALLERSMLHREWARIYGGELDADPTLSGVPVVASRRELRVVRDSINDVSHLEAMLLELLNRNAENQMAFEYLMAHYLLTRQLDKLAANLGRLDDFDYPALPRHCEEALVLHHAMTGSRDFDLGERKISLETQRRFREFVSAERRAREDASTAFAALYPDFGDSYFFCYVFGHNNPAAVEQSRSSR